MTRLKQTLKRALVLLLARLARTNAGEPTPTLDFSPANTPRLSGSSPNIAGSKPSRRMGTMPEPKSGGTVERVVMDAIATGLLQVQGEIFDVSICVGFNASIGGMSLGTGDIEGAVRFIEELNRRS